MGELRFDAATVGRINVPSLQIEDASIVELLLPERWSSSDNQVLVSWLERQSTNARAVLHVATVPDIPNRRSFGILANRRTLAQQLAEGGAVPEHAAEALCQQCGVDAQQRATLTPWTERKLIGFEIAAVGADIVVVDDLGFDPLGEERFVSHLQRAVSEKRFCVLAMRYPGTFEPATWSTHRAALQFCESG